MSIVFDHVEGVVQKAEEAAPSPSGAAQTTPSRPEREHFEEHARRHERLVRRLHAD